jgi:cytochrome d ubiquinol oxidase subunit II
MFESLTYLQLQQYWWIIISLLGGLFAFMMFIQGGQTLLGWSFICCFSFVLFY